MKLKELIDYARETKPESPSSAFSDAVMCMWANEIEGLVQSEILLLSPADTIEYKLPDDENTELLVPAPHSKIYRAYMAAMIDFQNGEYNKYQNSMELFNSWWREYAAWYSLNYDPASGKGELMGYYISAYAIAVKHGYEGTEEEWLSELDLRTKSASESAESAAYSASSAQQAANTYPRINDAGYWQVWDVNAGVYVDTDFKATGSQGPKGEAGETGPQGPQGDAGETPDLSEYAKTSEVDEALSEYAKTTEVNEALSDYVTVTNMNSALSNKVDKVNGKGLSTNDYTNNDKLTVDTLTQTYITGISIRDDKSSASGMDRMISANEASLPCLYAGKNISLTKMSTAETGNSEPAFKIEVVGDDEPNTGFNADMLDGKHASDFVTPLTMNSALANKVDKVDGKGLSTNDYTDSDKNKVNDAPGWVAPPKAGNVPVTVSAPAGYLVDSGFSLGASVPANAVFTDTHYKIALAMGNLVNAIHSGVNTDADDPYIGFWENGAMSAYTRLMGIDGLAAKSSADGTLTIGLSGDTKSLLNGKTKVIVASSMPEDAADGTLCLVESADTSPGVYGVRFEGSANNGATVRRLYDAEGLAAGVGTDTETAQNDFDGIYPWSARRRCCGHFDGTGNFTVNAYKGDAGYAEDGSNGEVWIEHSLFYYKHIYDGDAEEILISDKRLTGFLPAPIFIKQDGTLLQKAYTAAYPMATVDGKATSRSGVFSDIYSLNTAMTAARMLGENYTTATTAEWYTECLYMWVEFATRNLQSVMAGASSMPYTTDAATVAETSANRFITATAIADKYVVGQTIGIGTSVGNTSIANNRIVTSIETYDASNKAISFDGDPVNIAVGNIVFTLAWKNGSCDSVIASSGSPVSNTNGRYNCIYRGKERPYGDSFEWISDVLLKREGAGPDDSPYTYDPYFLPDATKYANGTLTEDYVKLNFQIPTADGYVKTLGLDDRFPWVRIPCECGAAVTTWYSDYYYYPRGALCAARVGGHWAYGSFTGPVYWCCDYAPSLSGVTYRARLSYSRI